MTGVQTCALPILEGTYTTFAEEQGQISFVIRPTGDVEKIHLTGIAEGETVNVEGTPYALNGAKEIKVERKGNGKLSIRLIDQNGKPVRKGQGEHRGTGHPGVGIGI